MSKSEHVKSKCLFLVILTETVSASERVTKLQSPFIPTFEDKEQKILISKENLKINHQHLTHYY